MKPKDLFQLIARLAIGAVFLTSGLTKALMPPAELMASFDAYQLFPLWAIKALSYTLPWVEIYIGLFVVTGRYLRWASLASSALFATFIVFLSAVLLKRIEVESCGCFGSLLRFSPKHTLLLDSGLLVLSIGLAVMHAKSEIAWASLDAWCAEPVVPSKKSSAK